MKTKVPEATNTQLDWLVAKCEQAAGKNIREGFGGSLLVVDEHDFGAPSRYSTDWSQGGPIIDRDGVTVGPYQNKGARVPNSWQAYAGWDEDSMNAKFLQDGPTPLIAAMRCFVASKLGDEVEVPDELA